jgi:hypothetical protein
MTARRPISGQARVCARANYYTLVEKFMLHGSGALWQTARAATGRAVSV